MKISKNRIFGPILKKLTAFDAHSQADQTLFYGPCSIFDFCNNKKSKNHIFRPILTKLAALDSQAKANQMVFYGQKSIFDFFNNKN